MIGKFFHAKVGTLAEGGSGVVTCQSGQGNRDKANETQA